MDPWAMHARMSAPSRLVSAAQTAMRVSIVELTPELHSFGMKIQILPFR